MTGDTMAWFEERGVPLKIEEDGRVFPMSNTSQSIIDCFLTQAQKFGVEVKKNHAVRTVEQGLNSWNLETTNGSFSCRKLLIATGSNPKIWRLLETLGQSITPAVPSLFTFDIDDPRIKNIPGVVAKDVSVEVLDTSLFSEGPLLVTHSGLSAPSILKLSAFGAIELARLNYKFKIKINFIHLHANSCMQILKNTKLELPKKYVHNTPLFELPKRLRNVEELLHERGVDVNYESVRFWWNRFGLKKALDKLPNVYQPRTSSGMQWHGIQPVIYL